jgi:hypothetical protein
MIFIIIQTQRAYNIVILIPDKFISYDSVNFVCREDQASMLILQLIITEVIVKILSLYGIAFVSWIIKKKLLKKVEWKPKFNESDEIVWVIYIQACIWFALTLYPYVVMI